MMLNHLLFVKVEKALFYLLLLFFPTQLGKHFWADVSIVSGLRIDYLSPTIYFTDIIVVLLFLNWLIKRAMSKNKHQKIKIQIRNQRHFLYSISVLAILYLILNILLSGNILNGFYHLIKFLEFSFIAFYVVVMVNSPEMLKKIILILAISAIGESLLAIAQFINQGNIGGIFYFLGERSFNSSTPGIANASVNGELILRPYGTLPHPNVLSGFLLCVMILCFGFLKLFMRVLQKSIIILCLLLGTGVLVLTMSRIAILLWFIAILVGYMKMGIQANKFLDSRLRGNDIKIKRFLLIVMFTILSVLIFLSPLGGRLLATSLTEESVVQRQELISSSFKLFISNPVFGVGLGNFIPSLPTVQRPISPILYLQPVHNIFILILTEIGIIGFGFFIWFLVKTYRYLLGNLETRIESLTVLTAVLALGLFDHYFLTLQQGQFLFSLMIGLCWVSFARRA